MTLTAYRKRTDELAVQYGMVMQQAIVEQCKLKEINDRIETIVETQQILQRIAQTLQQSAHDKIARIVTSCLNVVFDDPYEFKIRFDRKRGKTEARMEFLRDDVIRDDPLGSIGGGVVDIAALALRLACLVLSRPVKRKLVILDEPFRFVSRNYRYRVKAMIEKLAEDLGIQFIIVTHDIGFESGKVIRIGE